ncbi:MAG: hypothetical protein V7L27_25380 [Nostoc sp.]|uniref:hypothetical protein n=1 Tax=Nostoc sp. TaxID=1180 RepID=UPI002FF4FE92
MSQCGDEAARFVRGFHDASSSTGETPVMNVVAPQLGLPCMISLDKTTGDFLAIATLAASPAKVNLEVSGNGFI